MKLPKLWHTSVPPRASVERPSIYWRPSTLFLIALNSHNRFCAGPTVTFFFRHGIVARDRSIYQLFLHHFSVARVVCGDLRVGGEFYGWNAGGVSYTSSRCREERPDGMGRCIMANHARDTHPGPGEKGQDRNLYGRIVLQKLVLVAKKSQGSQIDIGRLQKGLDIAAELRVSSG